MRLAAAAATHIGHVREMNQDALLCRPELGLFLVADGMGGERAGEEASAQVVATITRLMGAHLANAPASPADLESAMRDALLRANHDVYQISLDDMRKRGLGSTASLLCLCRGLCCFAHVGDSRIYLWREGRMRQLTRDHSVVWTLFEQGLISREQMGSHPERNILTQCIGINRPIHVESRQMTLEAGDLFLICSDGLTGYMNEDAIASALTEYPEPQSLADRLVAEALRGGGGDNVSAVVVRVDALEEGDDWQPAPLPIEATQGGLADPYAETMPERSEAQTLTQDDQLSLPKTDQAQPTSGAASLGEAPPAPTAAPSRRRSLLAAFLVTLFLLIATLTWFGAPVKLRVTAPLLSGESVQFLLRQGRATQPLEAELTGPGMWELRLPRHGHHHLLIVPTSYWPQDVSILIMRGQELVLTSDLWQPMARAEFTFPAVHPALDYLVQGPQPVLRGDLSPVAATREWARGQLSVPDAARAVGMSLPAETTVTIQFSAGGEPVADWTGMLRHGDLQRVMLPLPGATPSTATTLAGAESSPAAAPAATTTATGPLATTPAGPAPGN